MEFNIGDFVKFRNSRWLVISVDVNTCDLMNGYKEEHWNANKEDITLIAKFR